MNKSEKDNRGSVREGGTHVPWLNFASSYVGILPGSSIACRNFVLDSLTGVVPREFDLVKLKQKYTRT